MYKKSLLPLAFAALMLGGLTGCSESDGPDDNSTGHITLQVKLDSEIISESKQSRAENYSVENLYLKITSEDGSYNKSWSSITYFDPSEALPVGQYNIEVGCGDVEGEGFDKHAFFGTTSVSIVKGIQTPVSVTATMPKAMISVTYTDNFKNYLSRWSSEIKSSSGKTMYVNANETRPVYIKPGQTQLNVEFTKPNGVQAETMIATFVAEPRYHYHYTVDLKQKTGHTVISVTFDDTMDCEEVDIDIDDDAINAEAPYFDLSGFDESNKISVVEGFSTVDPISVGIIAKGGLASLKMITNSTTLIEQGWPNEVELVNAKEDMRNRLESLNFKCFGIWNKKGAFSAIDLSKVPNTMEYITEKETHSSYFTFIATDHYTKVSEPVTVEIELIPLRLTLTNPSEIEMGQTEMTVDLLTNGSGVPNNLNVSYTNSNGVNIPLKIVDIISHPNNIYTLSLSGLPRDSKPVILTATVGKTSSEPLEIFRNIPVFTLSADPNNVFATYATLSVNCETYNPATIASLAQIYRVESNGSYTSLEKQYTPGNTELIVKGLIPGQANKLIATVVNDPSNSCSPLSVMTEAATQLPNNSFESWHRVAGQTQYWWIDYPGSSTDTPWGTLNQLTTSEGGNSFGTNRTGPSYCAFSGTQPTTDSKTGNAAYIATVGWGAGNGAYGSTVYLNSKRCKNINAGELYLGYYDTNSNQAVYSGWSMTSRPSAMEFYYKYTAKNPIDYGYAEIEILAENDISLVKKSVSLTPMGDYSKVTIPLSYMPNSHKAAKIKIIFRSSGNSACLIINDDNLNSPSFGNLTDGRYTGSELYIDDINLLY